MNTITCNMSGQPIRPDARRDSKGRVECRACGKSYKPTGEGLYRYHMRAK